jgi:hypothetical protein
MKEFTLFILKIKLNFKFTKIYFTNYLIIRLNLQLIINIFDFILFFKD